MSLARSFSRNPIGFIFTTLFIIAIIGYFIKGVFMNCIFLNEKYSDRGSCMKWELVNAIMMWANDRAERIQNRVENRIEHLTDTLLNTWTTNSWTANVPTR